MAERKSGIMSKSHELTITTCDICGRDLETVDKHGGYTNLGRYEITDNSNGHDIDIDLCSISCVKKYADGL